MKRNLNHVVREFLSSGQFIVRNDGVVFSFRNPQGHPIEKPREVKQTTRDGYKTISWKGHALSVHRLVYQAYLGELEDDLEINHIDGNRSNNHFSNLEQITHSENVQHAYRVLGNPPVIGNAKINQIIAEEIRRKHRAGRSYRQLVKEFEVSKTTIAYVIQNKIWKSS